MKRKKLLYPALLLFCFSVNIGAQSNRNIRFTNTGAMNVKGTMLVKGDMQAKAESDQRVVSVVHDGTTALTGSFFQDANGHVFKTTNNDWANHQLPKGITTSTGTFKFIDIDGSSSTQRYITTSDTANFDRSVNYIAFPKLTLSTNDIIYVPSTMGLDASIILRTNGKTGILYLSSNKNDGASVIFDASLRVTGSDGNYTVTPGSIVVEKRVAEFRNVSQASAMGSSPKLFPFATPFNNLRSGYFAGNWVRHPLFDTQKQSFQYPYGNEDKNNDGFIDGDQFVIYATDPLTPTDAYLIGLDNGGEIDDANKLFGVTAGEDHKKDKLIFNGLPYTNMGQAAQPKDLFRGAPVLSRTPKGDGANTQNYLVGNSYTSALSGNAIAQYLMANSNPVLINNLMYVFHHGATNYQTYKMYESSVIKTDLPDIQAMSVFMIRVSKNNTSTGVVEIGPNFQVHSKGSKTDGSGISLAPTSGNFGNRLDLRITPVDNPYIYDETTILLENNASIGADTYDIAKMRGEKGLFNLYGSSTDNDFLQRNALPIDALSAQINLVPALDEVTTKLTIDNVNSFQKDYVILKDKKLDILHDLKADNSYTFVMQPTDSTNRFEILFSPGVVTNVNNISENELWYTYNNSELLGIRNIAASLLNKPLSIYNTTGTLLIKQNVDSTPFISIDIQSFASGVYIVKLGDKTTKFVK